MKRNKKKGQFKKLDSQSATSPANVTGQNKFFTKPTTRSALVIASALLCILAITAYANAISNGFAWDDHEQVVMNSSLRPGTPLLQLVRPNTWGLTRGGVQDQSNYYRPLQMVTYRLTTEVFGFDARAFHAVNLALHLIVVFLVLALFYKLTTSIGMAFAAAALFAVHPIHTETVKSVPDNA